MGHVYASLEDVSNGCAVDSATRDAATLAQFQHDGSAPPVARWRGTGQTSRNAQALGRAHALTRDAGIAYCRRHGTEADAPDVASADGDDARLGRPARRRGARAVH